MKTNRTIKDHIKELKKFEKLELREKVYDNIGVPVPQSYKKKYRMIQAKTDRRFAQVCRRILIEAIDAYYNE